jgi:hypothetical protein
MEGVKALVVVASIYYPDDGVVAKNKYQTSSGQRYDQSAAECAALKIRFNERRKAARE